VSRALSRLEAEHFIRFIDNDRRRIEIEDLAALAAVVRGKVARSADESVLLAGSPVVDAEAALLQPLFKTPTP